MGGREREGERERERERVKKRVRERASVEPVLLSTAGRTWNNVHFYVVN